MSTLTITYFGGIAIGPLVGGFANEWVADRTHYLKNDPRHYMPSLLLASFLFLITAAAAYFIIPSRSRAERMEKQVPLGGDAPGLNPLAQAAVAETAADVKAAPASADEHGAFSLEATRRAFARFPFLMILALGTFMAVGLIIPYVKPFASERFHISETDFGKLLLLPAAIIGVLAVPVGRLADKFGKVVAVRGGMAACAAALWIIVSVHHQAAVVAGGVLLGLGFLFAFPAYMAFLSDLTGPEERGGTLGAVRAAQGVGAFLGTIISSFLHDKVASDAPFYAASVLLTVSFALSMIFIKMPDAPAADGDNSP